MRSAAAILQPEFAAYYVTKQFHFLGKPFRFGGFSHSAVLLFRTGQARFERLVEDDSDSLDMEVHERLSWRPDREDASPADSSRLQGLEAYIDRHNRYSSWEARLRWKYLATGRYGGESVATRLLGDSQERRRFLKKLVVRLRSSAGGLVSLHREARRARGTPGAHRLSDSGKLHLAGRAPKVFERSLRKDGASIVRLRND